MQSLAWLYALVAAGEAGDSALLWAQERVSLNAGILHPQHYVFVLFFFVKDIHALIEQYHKENGLMRLYF